mmetsp:Transcript_26028/g.56817  ORF Transcript_26028/g.56817 Transcript_26028/m.56817 type:complete len:411 (-) Transcript_26028:212-1444(-)
MACSKINNSGNRLHGRRVLPSLVLLLTTMVFGISCTFVIPSPQAQHTMRGSLAKSHFAGLASPNMMEQHGEVGHGHRDGVAMKSAGVVHKVLAAMGAGMVASVVSATLAAVTEPIMNRVLVKRMTVKQAISEMSPAMAIAFFRTTIATNLLKFPLFEAVSMFLSLLPNMNSVVRGLIVGFIFTTATLPITNFRYRMSIQTPVNEALKPSVLYQAYLPTVVRDMIYAIGRNIFTALFLASFVGVSPSSPILMFPVVIGACVVSAPLNEVRGFLLQSGPKKLSFKEFFKPVNFLRSTSLGALNMGISVATGYYLTPIVANVIATVNSALNTGSLWALLAVVISLDLGAALIASGMSKKVFTRRIDVNKDQIQENADNIEMLLTKMRELEAENKSLSAKVASIGTATSSEADS